MASFIVNPGDTKWLEKLAEFAQLTEKQLNNLRYLRITWNYGEVSTVEAEYFAIRPEEKQE